jgi:ADP-ribose pyrophosphatase YjhB (NUDIX family)
MAGMEETKLPVRLAGRVIVLDPDDRVLLFRYDNPPPKGRHWATPGGGLEAGEDYYAAAIRELLEETGWGDVHVRPVEVHQHAQPQWAAGRLVRQHDHYFVARVSEQRRPLGAVTAVHASDGIGDSRWWTLAELDATDETVYPKGLADLVRRLTSQGGPVSPDAG